MKKLSIPVFLVTVLGLSLLGAQAPGKTSVERLDPALNAIISPNATLEVMAEHFGLTEGPIWVQEGKNGHLLFSDISENVIYKLTPDRKLSVFLENSGYTGKDLLNIGAQSQSGRRAIILIGSNGLTLDRQGRVIICAQADRTVTRLEKDGGRTVLADRFEGKRFGGPNDVVVKSNGTVYFTDTPAGLRGRDKSPARELPFDGFYIVKDGKVMLGDEELRKAGTPNGIALSADEKTLYVGHSGKLWLYDIRADDTLTNRRMLIEVGSDGMRVDQKGNLYSTSRGEVWITSPAGKHLGTIKLPNTKEGATAANVAFGDADGKGLYITARTTIYKIRVNIPGVRPGPQ